MHVRDESATLSHCKSKLDLSHFSFTYFELDIGNSNWQKKSQSDVQLLSCCRAFELLICSRNVGIKIFGICGQPPSFILMGHCKRTGLCQKTNLATILLTRKALVNPSQFLGYMSVVLSQFISQEKEREKKPGHANFSLTVHWDFSFMLT